MTLTIFESGTLIELVETELKNNNFEFDEKNFKQLHGSSYDQLRSEQIFFLPPYAVLSMADLEEENFNAFEEKPVI